MTDDKNTEHFFKENAAIQEAISKLNEDVRPDNHEEISRRQKAIIDRQKQLLDWAADNLKK
ncbi:MAG TPA: hypothetical protein VFR80_05495 [Pyrinomonadaceae bacterium]|nr:hypothetical protein [Pyrinomonadaceae bacterium]